MSYSPITAYSEARLDLSCSKCSKKEVFGKIAPKQGIAGQRDAKTRSSETPSKIWRRICDLRRREGNSYQKYFPCCLASRTFFPINAFSNSAAEVPTLPKTFSSCCALTAANVLPTMCLCRKWTTRATRSRQHRKTDGLGSALVGGLPSPISGIVARADDQMMSCRDAIQDRYGCQTRRYSKAAGAVSRFGIDL